MRARDAPEIALSQAANVQTSASEPVQASAPNRAQSVTRNEKPAKSSKLISKRTRKPAQKRAKKPVAVTGYHWRQHGAGWDLRKDLYVTSNGLRKRKQPYLAHLSREAFRELKRAHKGAALEKAIAQWIADHDRTET